MRRHAAIKAIMIPASAPTGSPVFLESDAGRAEVVGNALETDPVILADGACEVKVVELGALSMLCEVPLWRQSAWQLTI